MTNKKFKKMIRQLNENNNYRIGNIIEDLFRKNNVPKSKIIRKITGSKTNSELLEENLEEIIEIASKVDGNSLFENYQKEIRIFDIYDSLSFSFPDLVPILEKNILKFIKEAPNCFCGIPLDDFMNKKENIDFIKENLEEFLLSFKGSTLEVEKNIQKFIDIPSDLKNKAFEVNRKEIYKKLFSLTDLKGFTNEDIELYSYSIDNIINELLERENCEYSDIELLGKGSFSNVLKIGGKVFKIGIPRAKYEYPNHKRILQPIIRTNLETKNGKIIACIEVSDYAEAFKGTEEDMKKIYEELEQDGIIYGDLKKDNLGILKKSNQNDYTDLEIAPESVGTNKKNDTILNKGDIVIIDIDHIYDKDDNNINNSSNLSKKLYRDYREKLKKEVYEKEEGHDDDNKKEERKKKIEEENLEK